MIVLSILVASDLNSPGYIAKTSLLKAVRLIPSIVLVFFGLGFIGLGCSDPTEKWFGGLIGIGTTYMGIANLRRIARRTPPEDHAE